MSVTITVRNLQKRIPFNRRVEQTLRRVVRAAVRRQHRRYSGTFSFCLVDDAGIREFNLLFLGEDRPTDVISFDLANPQEKKKHVLSADIIISAETAQANSRRFKTDALYELYLYAVHGALHAMGHDDRTPRERLLMHDEAVAVLTDINLCPSRKPKRSS